MLNDPLWALATSHHRSLPPTQRLFLAVQSVWPLPPWHRAIEITLPPLQLSFLDVVFHFWFSCSCPLLPPVHSLSRHIAVSALELHLCHVFTPFFPPLQLVAAHIVKAQDKSPEEAIAIVKSKRECAHPNAGFMKQLLAWHVMGYVSILCLCLWEVFFIYMRKCRIQDC